MKKINIIKWYNTFLSMIGGMLAGLIIVNLFAAATLALETVDKIRIEKELLRLELQAYEASND